MRLCEAACAPVCVSLNGGKHYTPRFRRNPTKRVRRKEEERRSERSLALLGRRERYGACSDDKQEKALPLFRRPGGHICPQCGQETRLLCPARKPGFRRWGKHSAWLSAPHFAATGGEFAGRSPHPLASSQSPLCSERPAGVGIPRAALLLLSSKRNPLPWASV